MFYTLLIGQSIYIDDSGTINMSLSDRNDFKILMLSSNIENNIQVGYSPVRNISIKTGYSNHSREFETTGRKTIATSGNVYSASIGMYYFFKKEKNNSFIKRNNFTNDIGILTYFNIGYSRGINKNDFSKFTSEFDYQKYFIDVGLKVKSTFASIDFNFKYTKVHFLRALIIGNYEDFEEFINRSTRSLEENNLYTSLELNIQTQIGIRQISIISGIPILFPYKINTWQILYSRARTPYIGVIIELDEIFWLIGKYKRK